jgi:hypothetical protein
MEYYRFGRNCRMQRISTLGAGAKHAGIVGADHDDQAGADNGREGSTT